MIELVVSYRINELLLLIINKSEEPYALVPRSIKAEVFKG